MNQSHSQIQQSIYQSHGEQNKGSQKHFKGEVILQSNFRRSQNKTNNMDLSKTGKVNHSIKKIDTQPGSEKVLMERSKTGNQNIQDATFIKYYQQNISLKRKQEEMSKQIQQLKMQLKERSQVQRTMNERQLAMLAAGKRSLWDTKYTSAQKNKSSISKNGNESNKVTNLLEIIQHYKAKLMTAQEQIQNLKRQKHLLEQDTKLKERKADQLMRDIKDSSSGKNNTFELEQKLQNATRLLEIEKQRNKFNEADIKRLETKIRALEYKQQQIEDLRITNKSLQDKLLRLTQLPSFSHVTQRVDEENKIKQAQEKYKVMSEKYNQLKTEQVKQEAELKLLRNQLITINYQADQLQKENRKLKAFSFENPILKQLAEDQELLGKVLYEIQNGKRTFDSKSELERQSYDKILMEKEMLANELTSLRAKMNAMQQTWKEKERISRIEKQQMINTFKDQVGSASKSDARVVSKNGVPYSDDVSMFTQDVVNIPSHSNYFDLFLGELHLLQTMLSTSFNMRSPETALILATVDFYNHNTETTRPVHGTNCNLKSQFSFKVTQDEFFFKYLTKGTFTVEIWGSEGNKRINLGKATIDLRPLVIKSRKNIAPVVSSSTPIYMNQRVMGSINFVMRMRLPIFDQLQKINELQQVVNTEDVPTRKLIIQIEQGRGFPQNSNTFVYFPFRLEDYYTKTFKGSNPTWNYYKAIQLKYNNDLKNYLRKNQLQFVILDDNAVIANEGDSDVIGSAYISLISLLQNGKIKERLTVMKGTQKMGQIDIKIYWHQQEIDRRMQKSAQQSKESVNIGEDLRKLMVTNKLSPDDIFYSIDNNRTGMISFQQFLTWTLKVNPKVNYDIANAFYKQFNQPVNLINFSTKLNQYKQNHTSEIVQELSEINRMCKQNTEMIKKKQSFEDYLKGKQIDLVSLDIDKTGDGKISKQEMRNYFQTHNIEAVPEMFNEEEINIVKFIKKYQNH